MVILDPSDRRQLIVLLQHLSILSTERERRLILEASGLKHLIPLIDVSGSSFVATSEIVSFLSSYGRLNKDYEALGVFLNLLKEYMGEEQKMFIDTLLLQ